MAIRARSIQKAIAVTMVLLASLAHAADTDPPEIISQGFSIAVAQQGEPGEFQRLRVRFEVPGRIAELRIRERSFEVDLATTPERSNLPLFGLDRQVRQMTDVTLNFRNYINRKLDSDGSYTFELEVVDRKGRRASAVLLVDIKSPEPQLSAEDDVALRKETFRAVRVGAAPVTGTEALGFTWRTVESNRVVIRLSSSAVDGYFFDVAPSEYAALNTQSKLRAAAQHAGRQPVLELATAANRSAGRVFGVFSSEQPLLLKVVRSDTSLSDVGTTVELEGEVSF